MKNLPMNIERQKTVNPNKRWAIIALNSTTMRLAKKIKNQHSANVNIDLFSSLKPIDQNVFESYSAIIYIMAMGIVVRHIAPYIKDKRVDPAVICVQSLGEYVIPVLSGHIGGANALSIELARTLDAQAVITTASDLFHTTAMDLFAEKYQLIVDSFDEAKRITAMLIEKKSIGLINKTGINLYSEDIRAFKEIHQDVDNVKGIVIITNQNEKAYLEGIECNKPILKLIPQNIILAVGCKKNKVGREIKKFIEACLQEVELDQRAIKKIVSIDLKAKEQGLIEVSQWFDVPFITYSNEEIRTVEDQFPSSPFVKETIGVGSVSMPTGYLASKKGRCIMERRASNGMTLSIWEEAQC